jgi:hypothetical protein
MRCSHESLEFRQQNKGVLYCTRIPGCVTFFVDLPFGGHDAARNHCIAIEEFRMKIRNTFLPLFSTFVLLALIAAIPAAAQKAPEVLKAGEYSASVKALVCGGCGPLVKQTMEGMKDIGSVSVDSAKKTVQFSVKKDATVKVADLQKALDGAAKKMGMGADYTLLDLKPAR